MLLMKLILGNGKTAKSIASFLRKQRFDFKLVADTRKVRDAFILQGIDEIFISPGIMQTDDIVILARKKNIPVVSDIELFSRYAKAPIVGITGSNGKSTVTTLLGEMVKDEGKKVAVGGNIGTPALDCLDDEIDYYVLELSSYQLDYTQKLNLITGVVLNITPDHLNRYTNFAAYADSKLSLYQYCENLVINLDEPLIPSQQAAKRFSINLPKQANDFGAVTCHDSCFLLKGDNVLMDIDEAQLVGEHNITNILCAFALGEQIGLKLKSMIESVKHFKGLEHRLEWVVKKRGIDYYNDSKATNAISTIKAIQALINKHKTISLILGGIQKEEDYSELFTLINKHISSVVLIGQSTQAFKNNLKVQTTHANSMQAAVDIASNPNCQAVLLSPACASFDMFDNFEQRGDVFKRCINDR